MHIRSCLAEAQEAVGNLYSHRNNVFHAGSYSKHLQSAWSGHLLFLLNLKPREVLQRPTETEQPRGQAAAASAPSPDASVKADSAQQLGGADQMPHSSHTTSNAQAADSSQHGDGPAEKVPRQHLKGFPKGNHKLLQIMTLSGIEALMQSKQDWSQLADETYQACVCTFGRSARQYVTSYAKNKTLNICSMPDERSQIRVISECSGICFTTMLAHHIHMLLQPYSNAFCVIVFTWIDI